MSHLYENEKNSVITFFQILHNQEEISGIITEKRNRSLRGWIHNSRLYKIYILVLHLMMPIFKEHLNTVTN